ncbi:trehalose-phosphatase [Halostella litorea]|uniref:trehalose-phosphatase n=1 Tax=Halostella litorea TaxID=2528831 RepID=UPI001386DE58|nr:trehalose-phosphatase [Halostella litorea]
MTGSDHADDDREDAAGEPPRSDPADVAAEIADRAAERGGLALFSDFDGTLAPIVERPDEAAMADGMADLLQTFRDAPAVTTAVVSGRALADLRERVGVDGLAYAGNHGLELDADGETTVHPAAADARDALSEVCRRLRREIDAQGVVVEDKGATATVHYRMADEGAVPRVRERVRAAAEDASLELTSGKAVLELRPRTDWDKGRAVEWLLDRRVPDGERPTAVYVGDDTTDEAAFRALPEGGVGVKVGDGETAADYRVADVPAVRTLLADVAASVGGDGAPE